MAKSDVDISGFPGVTGITVTYGVATIPTASIELVPGGAGQAQVSGAPGIMKDIEKAKRGGEITVTAKVTSHVGDSGSVTRNLKFTGTIDGMTMGNLVGGNTYQLVLKSTAQALLETTTITPGLNVASVNIYKNPSFAITQNSGDDPLNEVEMWAEAANINYSKSPIEIYVDLLKYLLGRQLGDWQAFVGLELLPGEDTPFGKIYNDGRYKKAVGKALEYFKRADLSAVTGGAASQKGSGSINVISEFSRMFATGSNVVLENFLSFLRTFGCTVVFSNSRMYVVPENSVLQQGGKSPGKKQLQTSPNTAGPADYNSYIYNDNGYRDISSVVVAMASPVTGIDLSGMGYDKSATASFVEAEGLSNASGVLVTYGNVWLSAIENTPSPSDNVQTLTNLGSAQSIYPKQSDYGEFKDRAKEIVEKNMQAKKRAHKEKTSALENYAETVFYQARYGDRHGSITMDFNPNWAPGTGGSLFVRETGVSIDFYVTTVTHRIDMSAPNTGTAITVVNFNCGRIGSPPAGAKEYKYLGYNPGKEKAVQHAFIGDVT